MTVKNHHAFKSFFCISDFTFCNYKKSKINKKKAKLIIKINTIEMIIARHKFTRLKYVIKPNNTPAKENKTAKK